MVLRRRILVVLAAASLLGAGCSKGDDPVVARQTAGSEAAGDAGGAGGGDSSGGAGDAADPDAPVSSDGGSGAPGGGSGGDGGPASPSGGASSPGSPGGSAAAAPAPAPSKVGGAVQGRYTYDVQGSGQQAGGDRQSGSGEVVRTVADQPDGTQTHSTSGQGMGSESRYRFDGDAVRITYLRMFKEFRPDPPATASPRPLAPGATWAWQMTSTDGKTTLKGDFKAVRTEVVDVGGKKVDTVVVESTVVVSGDFSATIKGQTWLSEELKLPVKEHQVIESALFSSEGTSTLRSTTPS